MTFDEWFEQYINEPVDIFHGLSRKQMWNEDVVVTHRNTARLAWYTAVADTVSMFRTLCDEICEEKKDGS